MFDVGFTEIFLIGIVSLIVIGPERLPAVAKTIGQWIGKLQRFVKGVKSDLASEMETGDLKKLIGDQREQINELRDMVSTAKNEFQSSTQTIVKSTKEGLNELETTVNNAKEPEQADTAEVEADVQTGVQSAAPDTTALDKPTDEALKTSESASAEADPETKGKTGTNDQ